MATSVRFAETPTEIAAPAPAPTAALAGHQFALSAAQFRSYVELMRARGGRGGGAAAAAAERPAWHQLTLERQRALVRAYFERELVPTYRLTQEERGRAWEHLDSLCLQKQLRRTRTVQFDKAEQAVRGIQGLTFQEETRSFSFLMF